MRKKNIGRISFLIILLNLIFISVYLVGNGKQKNGDQKGKVKETVTYVLSERK